MNISNALWYTENMNVGSLQIEEGRKFVFELFFFGSNVPTGFPNSFIFSLN